MDDLSVFRNFRRGVAAPSEEARRRASARMTGAIEGRRRRRVRVLRLIRRRPGHTALVLAALVGVSTAALFVSSPWKSSPGFLEPAQAARFLERAETALTPPGGTILHVKADWIRTSRRFGCTAAGPHEMWIDQASPHGWRRIATSPGNPALLQDPDPRTIACSDWDTHEFGGASTGGNDAAGKPIFVQQLMFVPPNTLRISPVGFSMPTSDPIQELRGRLRVAIARRSAHDEGTTEIDGRAVRRFRLDCPRLVSRCAGASYMYVDPETFLPVQLEDPSSFAVRWLGIGDLRFDVVWRFHAIEYLPRTAENLELTDIRAQHPDAVEW